jgi:hypothetical protein
MPQPQNTEQADFSQLSDPDFLAERKRVREALAEVTEQSPGRTMLAARYEALSAEFDRRASRAWKAAS